MDKVSLAVFHPELIRLVLLGKPGLPPAFGPIQDGDGIEFVWSPSDQVALGIPRVNGDAEAGDPLGYPVCWGLPLDASSPWPARLALVAAHLILKGDHVPPLRCAWLTEIDDDGEFGLYWLEGVSVESIQWLAATGESEEFMPPEYRTELPTFPQHLKTQPLDAAFLLAVWDATRKT